MSCNNQGRNNITHIFFDRTNGESQLLTVGYAAFYNCDSLVYFDMPNSIYRIKGLAFSNTAVVHSHVTADIIDESAYNACIGNLTNLFIDAKVQYLGTNAFGYINSLEHVQIGAENQPSQLNGLSSDTALFAGCPNLTDITIYTSDTNSNEWRKAAFTQFDTDPAPTVTKVQA